MALTPAERKGKLGLGGLKAVAEHLGVTEGHVSQVNSGKRRDVAVEGLITARILELHPTTDPATIWPVDAETAKREQVA